MTVFEAFPPEARDLVAQAGRLFAAWGEELVLLLPRRLRAGSRPGLEAEPLVSGGFRLSRRGRELSQPRRRAGSLAPVTLRLPAAVVLVCETPAPDASDADLVRMLSLDVDRLTPFDPADVFTAVALAPRGAVRGGRRALVGVTPKVDALDLITRARAAGLEPRAVLASGGPDGFPSLDFTGSIGESLSTRGVGRTRLLWLFAALLASIDIAVIAAHDVTRTRELRADLAVLRPRLAVVQRLRTRVLTEEARRAALLAAREQTEPLGLLDAVSRHLPDGAWVERLNWNGEVLRLSGYRREGVDVAAELRATPGFADVRNATSDVGGSAAAGVPFDVTVRVRRPPP
jgi:general secretion pathway protein L